MVIAVLAGAVLLVRAQRGDSSASGAPVSVAGAPTSTFAATAEAGLGALDSNAPLIGQTAPDFVLRDASGKLVKLSDLRGKVVWVNFWASWCVPCRKEMPDIQAVYDAKHADGLEVLVVNWKDDLETANGFLQTRSLTLPLLLDRGGSVYDQYHLQGLPDSFFVARDGTIAGFQYGPVTQDKARERLQAAGLP